MCIYVDDDRGQIRFGSYQRLTFESTKRGGDWLRVIYLNLRSLRAFVSVTSHT